MQLLEFLVGGWKGQLTTSGDAFGSWAGKTAASCTLRWGPDAAWIDGHVTTRLPGLGEYAMRIVITAGLERGYEAYVVNSFGAAMLCRGSLVRPQTLVLTGHTRAGNTQQVTYDGESDEHMRLSITESRDGGQQYLPHLEAIWKRTASGEGWATESADLAEQRARSGR